ncbi:MAG: hypothetical protein V4813_09435 [Gemmatimonadota bacterium]
MICLRVIAARLTAAASLAALMACSDSTGPAGGAEFWEYDPALRGLTGAVDVVLSPDLIRVTTFGGTTHAVLEPGSGREKFRISTSEGGSLYRAGPVVVLYTQTGLDSAASRVYDAESGRALFTVPSHPLARVFLGTAGSVLVSSLGDSLLIGNDRSSGVEIWRRQVAGVACTTFCGAFARVDAIGDELLLTRFTNLASYFIRVTQAGSVTVVPTSRDAFRFASTPLYGRRASSTAPVVVATSSGVTSLDPTTGATIWRTLYESLVPTGYYSLASSYNVTQDGAWVTARMLDSAGTAAEPAREIIVNANDGSRARERLFPGESGIELLRGACATSGQVRVLSDLRLEFVDVPTGRSSRSDPIPALDWLRTILTTGGFYRNTALITGRHIIVHDQFAQKVRGVRCAI